MGAEPGKAIKVKMPPFKKVTLATAQRYALQKGIRLGVRFGSDSGYIWRLSPEEIKAIEVKASRLVAARARKKK